MAAEDDAVTFRFLDGTIAVPFRLEVQPGKFLAGTVRPPTGREVAAHYRAMAKAKDDPDAVRAAFYARHVQSWNVEADVTTEAVAALPHALYAALEAVVTDSAGCELVLGKSDGSSRS